MSKSISRARLPGSPIEILPTPYLTAIQRTSHGSKALFSCVKMAYGKWLFFTPQLPSQHRNSRYHLNRNSNCAFSKASGCSIQGQWPQRSSHTRRLPLSSFWFSSATDSGMGSWRAVDDQGGNIHFFKRLDACRGPFIVNGAKKSVDLRVVVLSPGLQDGNSLVGLAAVVKLGGQHGAHYFDGGPHRVFGNHLGLGPVPLRAQIVTTHPGLHIVGKNFGKSIGRPAGAARIRPLMLEGNFEA